MSKLPLNVRKAIVIIGVVIVTIALFVATESIEMYIFEDLLHNAHPFGLTLIFLPVVQLPIVLKADECIRKVLRCKNKKARR